MRIAAPEDSPRTGRDPLADIRHWFVLGLPIAVCIVLPWRALGYDRFAIPKELALQLLAWIPALACIRRGHFQQPMLLDLAFAASVCVGAISAALAINPWLGFRYWAVMTAQVVVFWLARHLTSAERPNYGEAVSFDHDPTEGPVLRAVWAAALLTAAAVLLEGHGVIPTLSITGRGPGGVLGNRNFAAHLLSTSFPIAVAASLTAKRWNAHLIRATGMALMLAAAVVCRSRGAWLGGAAGLAVTLGLFAMSQRHPISLRRFLGLVASLAAGLAIALVPARAVRWTAEHPYRETLRRIVEYDKGTGRGRIEQYARALKILRERPLLGAGPGNWSISYALSASEDAPDSNFNPASPQPVNRHPNSDVFGMLAERGTLGVIAAVTANLLVFCVLLRGLKGPAPAAAIMGIGTWTAALVAGVFDAVALRPEGGLAVAAALGALVAQAGPTRSNDRDGAAAWPQPSISRSLRLSAPLPRPPVRRTLGAIAMPMALFSIGQQLLRFIASPALASSDPWVLARAITLDPGNYVIAAIAARSLAASGDCRTALPVMRRALEWSPMLPYAREVTVICQSYRPAALSAPSTKWLNHP